MTGTNKVLNLCTYTACTLIGGFIGGYEIPLSILLMLWVIDTTTGVVKYFRLGRLSSAGLWYGVIAKGFMLLIPLCVFLFARVLGQESVGTWSMAVLFSLLSGGELISVMENIYTIKTGEKISEQDSVTNILKHLLKAVKKTIIHITPHNK